MIILIRTFLQPQVSASVSARRFCWSTAQHSREEGRRCAGRDLTAAGSQPPVSDEKLL